MASSAHAGSATVAQAFMFHVNKILVQGRIDYPASDNVEDAVFLLLADSLVLTLVPTVVAALNWSSF
jgi:hypothetical protein